MNEITQLKVKKVEEEHGYSKYQLEYLEKGFGITIGNALKRILISSFNGFPTNTVTKVDFKVEDNVEHENLILEIYTNGSVKPEDVLKSAILRLKEYLELFVNLK